MTSPTPSERLRCRDCQSEKVEVAWEFAEAYLICHDCGVLFMPEDEDSGHEITASVVKCPHCESVDAIVVYGGEEQCNICGLDPSREDYPAIEIAHLWKNRSEEHEDDDKLIREVMVSGPGKFRHDSNIGGFLRASCGPHCSFAHACPQTTKIFSRCYREEKSSPQEDEVSKRQRKGKNKEEKARRKAERKAYQRLHSRAWLFAAGGGWYVRTGKYATETHHQEQSTS